MKRINLYWFRNDLRFLDNAALRLAASKRRVAAMYIYDPKIIKSEDFSSLHLDFINDSLEELSVSFLKSGSHLNIFHNHSIEVFREISKTFKIESVISHHDVKNHVTLVRDRELNKFFTSKNIKWEKIRNNGVINDLKNRDGWSRYWNAEMKKIF